MATTIRELLVKLGVDVNDAGMKRFDKGLQTIKKGMAFAVVGAVALGAALIKITKDTAAAGDEAAKAAVRIGITAEEMQELTFAANLAGAEMSDVEVGFRRLAANAFDTSKGTGEAKEAFDALGVSVVDSSGELKGQLALFEETAQRLSEVSNLTRRAALAQDIFGRSGSKLLPLLNAGAEGIRKMRQEARDLGLVMSEEDTKAAEEFTDSMLRLQVIAKGLRNTIGTALIPRLTKAADATKEWFLANKDLIEQRLDDFLDGVERAADSAVKALDKVNDLIENLGGKDEVVNILKSIAAALVALKSLTILSSLVSLFSGLAAIVGGVTLAAFAEFVALALAVAAAVLLLVAVGDDLITFFQGGDSALGRFIAKFQGTNTIVGKAIALFNKLAVRVKEVAEVALPILIGAGKLLLRGFTIQLKLIGKLFTFLIDSIILPLAEGFIDRWTFALDVIKAVFDSFGIDVVAVFDSIFGAINVALDALESFLGIAEPIDLGMQLTTATANGAAAPTAEAGNAALNAQRSSSMSMGGDTITIPIDARGMDANELGDVVLSKLEARDRQKRAQMRERFRGGDA